MHTLVVIREDDTCTEWYCETCGYYIRYNRLTRRYERLADGDRSAGHSGMSLDFATCNLP